MNVEVKIGDIVYLNSDSPKLIVTKISSDGKKITVMWLDENNVPQTYEADVRCFQKRDEYSNAFSS